MSSVRQFAQVSLQHGDRRILGVEVRCRCGFTEAHPKGSHKGFDNGVQAEARRHRNYFERRGWRIGERPQDDRCPACLKAIEAEKAKPKLTIVPKTTTQEKPTMSSPSERAHALAPAASKAPPEPTREDKRLIVAKLDETYDTAALRYAGSWTDAKVATDMGVPRAWVEKLRNDLYGPEGSNQEINAAVNSANAILAEAKTLLANTDKAIKDCKATLGTLEASHQRLAGMVDRTERMIEGIEKAVRP